MSSANIQTQSTTQNHTEQIQGVVERLTFASPESGYSVARLKVPGERDLVTIVAIDSEEQEATIQFDQRLVSYDWADLNEIALAWSISIHKSQGSEYPVVIVPLYMTHFLMLSRNLFYTALTRAKQLAVIVGVPKAIGLAVRQVKDKERYTLLAGRLG
ncbi:ATP-binding domain-containing protein [Floridanema aerugineum]|uniref:ATP-binding domain-containing protein n=1 Tax=Floridaenema aerugineum BLCC-F46 TaxID=3153654 RepID=A0ABV4X9J3_9CYAN